MSHQTCKRCLTIFVMTNEEYNKHCESITWELSPRRWGYMQHCSCAFCEYFILHSGHLVKHRLHVCPPSQCGMLRCAAPGVHWHYMTTLHWSLPRTLASLRVKCYHRHHTLAPPHISWAYLLELKHHDCIC